MYRDLQEFVDLLESKGELIRIRAEVDPELEITEIADRVMKAGGPALLFENVKGSDIPVLINAFGSEKRMALALGVSDLNEITEEIRGLIKMAMEGETDSLLGKLKILPKLNDLAKLFPKTVSKAPCQEVVSYDPDLTKLPVLKCWPHDGGRYITLPLVFTKNPQTGKQNCGMYRLQIFDKKTTGMHWHIHKDGAANYRQAEASGERFPVAVAIGGDPALTYAATAPLPGGIDEMLLAGFLRKKPVEMVQCKTVDLKVPADADIILEGYVDPQERRIEGPFGDHTGFYSLADEYPVFHVTCITHRKSPIYLTTIVGIPPMEDAYLALASERIFLPLFQLQLPEVVDMHLPIAGVQHNLMILSIKKSFPGHAQKVMHAVWGMGQAMYTKVVVVVDADVDVRNYTEVVWKVLNNVDPGRDITIVKGPIETLDHASPLPKFGTKMGIDATRKWESEGFTREWPEEIRMSPEIKALVDARWKEYGLE
ncbi:MAG: menaquinone biosynthesis decarboxylase [Firmicutes bacterium]|nr:menaquinone biosynthesis decarboxylase [Bacillota bacterium]